MNGRRTLPMLTPILLAALLAPALAAVPPAPAPPPGAPGAEASPPVARIGSLSVSRAELDARSAQALAEFSQRNGNRELPSDMRDLLRRQVLEGVIRMNLLGLEAERTGQAGTPQEAEEQLQQNPAFNPGGRFDPARFAAARMRQPQVFAAALTGIERQLGARKLYERLTTKYAPTEEVARAIAERQLTTVTIQHLSLRLADFNGTFPEPREADVLAAYRANLDAWRRPDRATLTVAFVNSPGLGDSAAAVPGARAAWSERMRAVADSVLELIHSGTGFEDATAGLGERAHIGVTPDNLPTYWQGTAAQKSRLFDPAQAGKPVPEPIRSADGWLLVRVDEVQPAHIAPLAEVARDLRARLREDQRLHHEEHEERQLYPAIAESLAAPGWTLRYAAIDTAQIAVPPPSQDDLDRWFRGHLADYSSFDAHTGAIVEKQLADVRDDVRLRWLADRRVQLGRELADQLLSAWSAGRRAPDAESRVRVLETPPIVAHAVIDTGLAAGTLGDTLWSRSTEPQGAGSVPWERGWLVWQVTSRVPRAQPTFEQARPILASWLQAQRDAAAEQGARRVFDADSLRFNQGNVVHISAVIVNPVPLLAVPLTHAEVERYHREHIDRYSAPELVTARHILVRPADGSPAADRAALARARELLARARAGEDFATLARKYSDDEATRDNGGDLGAFARGTMLPAFENAAFALHPGELSPEPVRTSLGYHVILCTEHASSFVTDFKVAYPVVASDAAHDKAIEIAHQRADSMLRVAPTPRALRALAARMGYTPTSYAWQVGAVMNNPERRPLFEDLVRLKPGQFHRPAFFEPGQGYWIAWVDSITPPQAPSWVDAHDRALDEYRHGAGRRALDAKKGELDSLFAAGWSLDSVATLWGGLERVENLAPGKGVPTMGATIVVDSLLFGGRFGPGVPVDTDSGWQILPQGYTRFRVLERKAPPPDQVAQRVSLIRSVELEQHLRTYFADLERRWPVHILDPTLRDISLVGPPPGISP